MTTTTSGVRPTTTEQKEKDMLTYPTLDKF